MTVKDEICSVPSCGKHVIARGLCSTHYWRWWKHGDPMKLLKRQQGDAARFVFEQALNHAGDDCLIWPFNRNCHGYAYVGIEGRKRIVSRMVCEIVHGEPASPDMEAAHTCGRGADGCVAPNHLRWATHIENEADKGVHGTKNIGGRNGGAKIAEAEVREILALAGSTSQKALASRYGISQQTVSKIVRREKWGWLDATP